MSPDKGRKFHFKQKETTSTLVNILKSMFDVTHYRQKESFELERKTLECYT